MSRRTANRRNIRGPGTYQTFSQRIRSMGAVSHLDPGYGATDDGTTSTWVDRLLAGHTLASIAQASRLIYSSSIAGLNGQPGWVGLAANSTHLVSSGNQLASLLAGTAAHTTYVVRRANPVVPSIVFCLGKVASADYIYFGCLTNGVSAYVRNVAGQTSHIGAINNTTTKVIESYVFTGTTAAVWSNGAVASASAADTKSVTIDRSCVGGLYQTGAFSSPFSGEIGDIITFPVAHTQAQRWAVESLLAAKYGITVVQA